MNTDTAQIIAALALLAGTLLMLGTLPHLSATRPDLGFSLGAALVSLAIGVWLGQITRD